MGYKLLSVNSNPKIDKSNKVSEKYYGVIFMGYKLLSGNPKIDKSNKVSEKYWSCIMHLRPVNTKICPYQDIAGCKSACLNTAGLGGVYPSIQKARQKKTDLFLDDQSRNL